MNKSAFARKTARIAGSAAVLGATAALILVGSPADAATVGQARGIVITMARGI